MRLSRQGYGSIVELEQLSIDKFIDLIHYENYLSDYQDSFRQLNRKQ